LSEKFAIGQKLDAFWLANSGGSKAPGDNHNYDIKSLNDAHGDNGDPKQ